MGQISAIETLHGTLSSSGSLNGSLSASKSLTGSLSSDDVTEAYGGEYRVSPRTDSHTELMTKGLLMVDNVVVDKIPYYENDNLSDGLTVYIGE